MSKKRFLNSSVIVVALIIIIGVVGYLIFSPKRDSTPTIITNPTFDTTKNTTTINPPESDIPSLSQDKKSIITHDKVLLTVDDNTIYNWFKFKSQLCDGYNLTSTLDRKMFCENKTSFKSLTRFGSIVISPDKMKIGFTVESDTLSPDKVVGIFLLSKNNIQILTNYYLGNEFVSFSPSGTNFVFSSYCFENLCGFTIKNSVTLADEANFGNTPDHGDFRFVKWVSDQEIEYKAGNELKKSSL